MFPNKEILYVARNEKNSVSGGVFGVTYLSALEVETLWVHEDYRGQGVTSQRFKRLKMRSGALGASYLI